MYGSGAVSCSCSLLIRGPNLARCQAEAPLIALCRFSKPALKRRRPGMEVSMIRDARGHKWYIRFKQYREGWQWTATHDGHGITSDLKLFATRALAEDDARRS